MSDASIVHEDITDYENDRYHRCSCGREYYLTDAGSLKFIEHLEANRPGKEDEK